MHDSDTVSRILLPFKLIPLKPNSKMPISSWVNTNYSVFDFLPGGNRAIVIGDKHCVLDVEGPGKEVNGLPHLHGLIQAHGDLPETLSWKTPSGGEAYLFSVPRAAPHRSMARTVGLELRTGQHYHLIPDSIVNGKAYEWETIEEIAEIPDWLLEYFSEGTAKKSITRQESGAPEASLSSVVVGALNFLNPTCDYEQWIRIGMACKAAGLAFETWKAWSQQGENACKDDAEYLRKWQSFTKGGLGPGTLIRMAREQGFDPPKEEIYLPASLPKQIEKEFEEIILEEPQGLLKELKDHFMQIANQPQFALGAAIFCMNAVTQRSFFFQDAPQNGYHVLIGESGARKTSIMNAATSVLSKVSASLAMNDPRSIANFKKQLSEVPCRSLTIDEIGHELLNSVYGRHASSQSQDKFKLILELHGCPKILQGHGTASKETKTTAVLDPRVSILSTGTQKDFEELLSHRTFVDGGLFSRMVVWKGAEQPISRFVFGQSSPTVSGQIVDALKALKCMFEVSSSAWVFEPISVSNEIATFWGEFHEKEIQPLLINQTRARSIVERSFHQGIQFAYLHALGCERRHVELVDAAWGANIALVLLKQSLHAFGLYQHDRLEQAIEAAIQFLRDKGPRTWRDLYKSVRALKNLALDDRLKVHTHLSKSGDVRISKDGKFLAV